MATRPTPLPPWYVDDLKQQITALREMLQPLESGSGSIGGRTMGDATQDHIARLKKNIADLESILDGSNAHRP